MKQNQSISIRKVILQLLIPMATVMVGILALMYQNIQEIRNMAFVYIENTAELNVERINRDIMKMNREVINTLNKNGKEYENLKGITPRSSLYYDGIEAVSEVLRELAIQCEEVAFAYLYLEKDDVIILSTGTIFPESFVEGRLKALQDSLRSGGDDNLTYSRWEYFEDETEGYVYSRYGKNGVSMGCVIQVDSLLSDLHISSLGYEGVPYIVDDQNNVLISWRDRDKITFDENGGVIYREPGLFSINRRYKYMMNGIIGNSRALYIQVLPSGDILDRIMKLQVLLVVMTIGSVVGALVMAGIYFQRILKPMKIFVDGLKNVEEEQWISEDGKNNILELEMANREFKELLRKIQALKIDIYEKELARQKTELEALQMQIKPHFYLNCLNLIHRIADSAGESQILQITQLLAEYMRYYIRGELGLETIEREVHFAENYARIQQLRYGTEAFSFEVMEDEGTEDYLIPALVIHNFVENAITHAVSLDNHVEISLYIATEQYKGGEFLYISISDTGKGFPQEVLNAVQKEEPIWYGGREHIGISNSMKRLKLIYGENCEVSLSNMGDHYGAVVEIRVPVRKREDDGKKEETV